MSLAFLKKLIRKQTGAFVYQNEFNDYILEYRRAFRDSYTVKMSKLVSFAFFKNLSSGGKITTILYCVKQLEQLRSKDALEYGETMLFDAILTGLTRVKMDATPQEVLTILDTFKKSQSFFGGYPITYVVKQLQYFEKVYGKTEELLTVVKELLTWQEFNPEKKAYWGADLKKVRMLLERLKHEGDEHSVPPYTLEKDQFGDYVNPQIEAMDQEEQNKWYALFHHCLKATQGKPSEKYLKDGKALVEEIQKEEFKTMACDWLSFVTNMTPVEVTTIQSYEGGEDFAWTEYKFLVEKNNVLVKGIVWLLSHYHDVVSIKTIGSLCERSFEKTPGVGPKAGAVGNACIYALANSKGLDGIGQLSRLKLKVKQNNTRKLIKGYLEEAAEKLAISTEQIEEMAIPEFGLVAGSKVVYFDDYKLELTIERLGKVAQVWIKPDGSPQKSAPAFIKQSTKLSDKLKKVKA